MKERFGALFDLDGVLVDTEGIYTEFWSSIDRRFPTGVKNFAFAIKGNTLTAILNNNFPAPEVQKQIVELLVEHEKNMDYKLFPGVDQFLSSLCEAGIPMAIVTSSDDKKMSNLFRAIPGFAERFKAIITSEDVSRSKPDPQGYIIGAHRLGIPSERCIVFEDSFAGLEAGRHAGGRVVGLATTQPRSAVEPLADITVGALAELTVERLASLFD